MKNFKLSTATIKKSAISHSAIGLPTAALLYLICLTGTLSVFFEEFERWEQPTIEEYRHYSISQIDTAIAHFQQRVKSKPETLWVVLPTETMPRMHISGDDQEWFINQDGSLSAPPLEAWTKMVTKLHMQLHLPQNVGLILVGTLGMMLASLILSGLLSHPGLFKDAFRWRTGRHALTQVDIHNRLGVWAAPFFLAITLTGSFIGLMGLFGALTSVAFYDNNITAVIETVFGDDPVVTQAAPKLEIKKAFQTLKAIAPNASPNYLAIQNIDTEGQYMEIAVTLPQRLIFSEIYRFHANGELINHQEFSDGEAGRQIAISVYRLHFGSYAGFWLKAIYAILGLALTVVCASGINIWLLKRKHESVLNDCWVAVVWGQPLALAASALFSAFGMEPLGIYCITQVLALCYAMAVNNPVQTRKVLMLALIGSLFAIVVSRIAPLFNETVTAIFNPINFIIFVVALMLSALLFHKSRQEQPINPLV
ncbi:MAG: PepSY domain-containing protein [Pseudomonadales bacterium]|nr:PepSY domain-containing protein [Pseudomonadales bacterium]